MVEPGGGSQPTGYDVESDVREADEERSDAQPDASVAADGADRSSSMVSPSPVSGADRARLALDQAKSDARRRGAVPGQHGAGSGNRGGAPASGRAGRRARGFPTGDPLSLSSAIDELLAERGWEVQAAAATVFARWGEIVGAELALHTRPESLIEGELVVVADSAAWATQVRLLSGDLLRRVSQELGDAVAVERVRVHGPGRSAGSSGSRFRRGPHSR